jgi:hypothetical protein
MKCLKSWWFPIEGGAPQWCEHWFNPHEVNQ